MAMRTQKKVKRPPLLMTLAGIDPSAGAGIYRDLHVFHRGGGYGVAVATAMTVQNTLGVKAVYPIPVKVIREQWQHLFADRLPDGIKIGMLANKDIVREVMTCLQVYQEACQQQGKKGYVILDPVLISSSGHSLLEPRAWPLLIQKLFPLCSLITPNLPEAHALLGRDYQPEEDCPPEKMVKIILDLQQLGIKNVLLKGGHHPQQQVVEDWWGPFTEKPHFPLVILRSPRIHQRQGKQWRGTGCFLSSSILVHRCLRGDTLESLVAAKADLLQVMEELTKKKRPSWGQGGWNLDDFS